MLRWTVYNYPHYTTSEVELQVNNSSGKTLIKRQKVGCILFDFNGAACQFAKAGPPKKKTRALKYR